MYCNSVVTEISMVSEGKTSASEKLDSFSDKLVMKRNVGDVPLPGGDLSPHVCALLGAANKIN